MSVTTYDLGTVLMVPKGDWNSTTAYERLNLVRHNGTAWLCTVAAGQTSVGEEPSSSATNWEVLVQDQSSVTSVNGQRGDVTIDESDIVHKAGIETITGNKTFTGTITAPTPDEDDESTKVATTEWVKNTTLTNAVGSGANLFDIKWSDHRLNDMSWLRSDTFSWQNGNVYTAAYNELLNEYENRSDQTVYKAFAKANYTAVGSNIKEWRGIVTGFNSNTDYITHPVAQPTTSMEYVVKAYSTIGGTTYSLMHCNNAAFSGITIRVVNATTGQINAWITTNGTSWNIASKVNTNCTLPVGVWKWFKAVWNGSTVTLSESIDGINYEQKYSVACTAAPKFNTTGYHNIGGSNWESYPFTGGKIDLQECYFKADGNLVWSGADFIEYAITDKKYRIALPTQAEKIKQFYDDYGIAWYYILDSTNTRFKLPRTKFGFTGLRSGVGNFVEAGLPNITGDFNPYSEAPGVGHSDPVGVFYVVNNTQQGLGGGTASDNDNERIGFDASRSSAIYGNSDTVQPPATEMYLYHYVGNFNRQAVLANIGVTSENIDSTSFLNTPVGTIIWSMANSVPPGYLLCNGTAVARLAYPELFAAIGTTFGEGDGDTTFNLPDLIGKFVEGGAVAGTAKNAGLPNIVGKIDASATQSNWQAFGETVVSSTTATGPFELITGSHQATADTGGSELKMQGFTFDASRSNSIYGNSDTVQPPAVTALPCIKAFSSVVGDATVVAGQLVNDIQSKVALDGSNLSGAAVKAVVETWLSGTEWYRIWSDGWCEQGGVFNLTSQNMFVQLYKPYNDTNFSILVSNSDSDTNNKINSSAWREKSTTGFRLFQGYGESFFAGPITWQAKGYIS